MNTLSDKTLQLLIIALDEKLNALQNQVRALGEDDDNIDYLEMEMMDLSNAAIELKNLYEEAYKQAGNLPPYEELISR
jgi:hypothetical protein